MWRILCQILAPSMAAASYNALVNTGNRSQINNTVVTDHLHILKKTRRTGHPSGAGVEVNPFRAKEFVDMIENTILITKDRLENRLYHYPGNK